MFNRFIIKTEEEFTQSILRTLGQGTFDVEIWPENWFDIYYEAYGFYTQYAYNRGYTHKFVPIILEQGVNEYDVSKHNVISALKVYSTFDEFGSLERLSMYQGMFMDMFSSSQSGAYIDRVGDFLIDYANFTTMKDVFKREFLPTYYMNTGILDIHPKPKKDSYAFLECYVGEKFENLFNDPIFRRLCVGLAKKQWYENLAKFDDLDFAGKGNINIQRLKDEAKEDIDFVFDTIKGESDGVEFFID